MTDALRVIGVIFVVVAAVRVIFGFAAVNRKLDKIVGLLQEIRDRKNGR